MEVFEQNQSGESMCVSPTGTCFRDIKLETLKSLASPRTYNFGFCQEQEINKILQCLRDILSACKDDIKGLSVTMFVNVSRTESILRYFCDNRNELTRKSCGNLTATQECRQRMTDQHARDQENLEDFREIWETSCSFYSNYVRCYTDPMGEGCETPRRLFSRLVGVFQLGYCYMSDADKRAALKKADDLVEALSGVPGSHDHTFGKSVFLLTLALTLWPKLWLW
ncbi:uncharacterized protein LOC112572649 isoform X2 [Pomacea canaliculata]|uniref:uncharacterized protein LOC112572649 isoform X2 n=1 Tax=Pomacea canaliculata TaxID=400727 RepID=UPI000D737E78|nr:uncharacterized protein LOC112572649 isoform X2 [Pomacea canaliculata]